MEIKCHLNANTIYRLELGKGTYLIECIHSNGLDRVEYDYIIADSEMEYLLRVDLKNIQRLRIQQECSELPFYMPFSNHEMFCVQNKTTKLYGVINKEYNEIIPFQYDGIRFCGNYLCVSQNGKCGLIDIQGQLIINCLYETIDIGDCKKDIFFLHDNTGWGMISLNNGRHSVPCTYLSLHLFFLNNNFICAQAQNGNYGIIDWDNNTVLPFDYSAIEESSSKHRNAIIVKETNGLSGIFDLTTRKFILPCRYSWIRIEDDGYLVGIPQRPEQTQYLTTQGELKVKIVEYDYIQEIEHEEEDLIPPQYTWCDCDGSIRADQKTLIVETNGKYGLINIHDKSEILPCVYDYLGYETEEGVIPCILNGIWGSVTKTGIFTTKLSYHEKRQLDKNRFLIRIDGPMLPNAWNIFIIIDNNGTICSPQYYEYIGQYLNGRAWVQTQGKWGQIDTNGEILIPCQYEDIEGEFSENLMAVQKQEKWGYINFDGNIVLPFVYDHAYSFQDGIAKVVISNRDYKIDNQGHFIVCNLDNNTEIKINKDYDIVENFIDNVALVCKNGLWGGIDLHGREMIPLVYDEIGHFDAIGLARCKKNKHWGFINLQGAVIIPFIYDEVSLFSEDLAACKKDQRWGFIDRCGNTIIPFQFEWASSFHNGYAQIGTSEECPMDIQRITSQNINDAEESGIGVMSIGFINKQGMVIIQPQYLEVSDFSENGTARVFMDEYYYDINPNNEIIDKH